MPIPFLLKIRVAIIVLAAGLGFWLLGWPIAEPHCPASPMTLFRDTPATQAVVVSIVLGLGCMVFALLVARRYSPQIAPLVFPAGLAAWGLLSPSMGEIFIRETSVATKQHFFHLFIFESVIWSLIVVGGCALAHYLGHLLFHRRGDIEEEDQEAIEEQVQGTGAFSLEAWGNWPKAAAGLVVTAIIAGILMLFLTRAGQTEFNRIMVCGMPLKGQIVFSVFAAFWLATLAVHQSMHGNTYSFLLAPLLVSAVYYFSASQSDLVSQLFNSSAVLFPSKLLSATILPIQFVGIGCLGVLAGYWYSVQLHHARASITE